MIVYVIVVLLLLVSTCDSFADWMTNDFCDRPLSTGEIIMNNMVVASKERLIVIKRDGKPLKSGDEYIPGETLEVSLTAGERNGQQVYECSKNAKFQKGGCKGTRFAKKPIGYLDILKDTKDTVTIVSGMYSALCIFVLGLPFFDNLMS